MHSNQAFIPTTPPKQLLRRSLLTSMLLSPMIQSQPSLILTCLQHLTQLLTPFSKHIFSLDFTVSQFSFPLCLFFLSLLYWFCLISLTFDYWSAPKYPMAQLLDIFSIYTQSLKNVTHCHGFEPIQAGNFQFASLAALFP